MDSNIVKGALKRGILGLLLHYQLVWYRTIFPILWYI